MEVGITEEYLRSSVWAMMNRVERQRDRTREEMRQREKEKRYWERHKDRTGPARSGLAMQTQRRVVHVREVRKTFVESNCLGKEGKVKHTHCHDRNYS